MADPHRLTLDLPRHLSAESIARRELARWFKRRACDVLVDDVQLVASELVTNAVRHGVGAIRLDAQSTRDTVSMQIHDRGAGFAVARRRRQTSGLAMVDAVCERWGVGPGATNVWCELRRGARAAGAP
jgi:anti-sigma regulatory factor (Ser/Thr protein kinase)